MQKLSEIKSADGKEGLMLDKKPRAIQMGYAYDIARNQFDIDRYNEVIDKQSSRCVDIEIDREEMIIQLIKAIDETRKNKREEMIIQLIKAIDETRKNKRELVLKARQAGIKYNMCACIADALINSKDTWVKVAYVKQD